MKRFSPLTEEVIAVGLGLLIAGAAGFWLGYPSQVLLLAALLYIAWHLLQLFYMNHWLSNPKKHRSPIAFGAWRTVVSGAEALRERSRKRKRKLHRMLNRFHESSGALPDATLVLDDEGRIEWWNRASKTLLGINRKRDKWKKVDVLISDEAFHRYMDKGDFSRPLQMQSPVDPDASLEVRVVPYGSGKRLLQARDVTRLQQLERVRRDFVANVSHEIRTPLTVVHGYLETMVDSDEQALQPWQNAIVHMQQQTTRIRDLVEDLLLLSRLESSDETAVRSEVDVPGLLLRLRNDGQRLSAEKAHRFSLDIESDLWLRGDSAELYSAFSNLIFNAVRYTPPGGAINLSWKACADGVCLAVSDSGIGIESEHIPRLTERFYRADVGRSRQSGGTGLGLAIVKHVLTRHDGWLKISSKPGKGSTFSCFFPQQKTIEIALKTSINQSVRQN